jgi:hypothetical protein
MPSSCSHVRLKAATLSVVSARKVLLPPAEDGRAPPVFNAYGGSRVFRFGTCNESHSMQSRQSTVVTITFLNAPRLSGKRFPAFHFNQDFPKPQFPPQICQLPRPESAKAGGKPHDVLVHSSLPQRPAPCPGASRRFPHVWAAWATRLLHGPPVFRARPRSHRPARVRAHTPKCPKPILITSCVPLPRRVRS